MWKVLSPSELNELEAELPKRHPSHHGPFFDRPFTWKPIKPCISRLTITNQSIISNTMQDQTNTTEFWAIVEMMGHQKIAGKLTEQVIGGSSFIRVDVPELPDSPAFTRLLTDKAIYAINPVTQEVARHMAQQIRAQPINAWDARKMFERQLQQSGKLINMESDEDDEDEDEFEFEEDNDGRGL
jgi:hypothetical protein